MDKIFLDFKYSYSNARIKGMKGKLFSKDKFREIRSANSLVQFIEIMEESQYKQSFVNQSIKHSGLELIRNALEGEFIKTVFGVLEMSPEKAKGFINYFLLYWRINDLKKIISAKMFENKISLKELTLTDKNSVKIYQPFIEASDWQAILFEINHSKFAPAFVEKKEWTNDKDNLRKIFKTLDDYYENGLVVLENQTSETYLKKLISLKIDIANSINVLRIINEGRNFAINRQMLIKRNPLDGFTKTIMQATEGDQLILLIENRTKVKISEKAIELYNKNKDISMIENELNYAFEKETKKIATISVMSLSTTIAYLFLKKMEVSSLLRIANSIDLDLRNEVLNSIMQI